MPKLRSLALLPFVVLGACRSTMPSDLRRALVVSPSLAAQQPADIAVLPIQDGTPGRVLEPHYQVLRKQIAAALAKQLYSPLAPRHVDERLGGGAASAGAGRIEVAAVDASFVKGIAGRCDEDAVLGVRVTRWDEASIMENARVHVSAEVLMVGREGAVLWSGTVQGWVKSGGDGPAPIARQARTVSALQVFADSLIAELPQRRRF